MKNLIPVSNSKKNIARKTYLFEHVKIQTNNLCTRGCPYCFYGTDKSSNRKTTSLSEKVVLKMIGELSDLKFSGRLGFYEINEPLTDPRMVNFVEVAVKKIPSAWHMLTTNGDLLTERILKKLINAGINQICVSVYDDRIKDKINSFLQNDSRVSKIIEVMNLINGPFIDNRGGNIKYKDAKETDKYQNSPCERICQIICVRPTGKVVSCFSDFYEINVMGDVYMQSLKKIWFGKSFETFRKNLNSGNRKISSLCFLCNYPGSGGFFKSYKKK